MLKTSSSSKQGKWEEGSFVCYAHSHSHLMKEMCASFRMPLCSMDINTMLIQNCDDIPVQYMPRAKLQFYNEMRIYYDLASVKLLICLLCCVCCAILLLQCIILFILYSWTEWISCYKFQKKMMGGADFVPQEVILGILNYRFGLWQNAYWEQ